MLMKYPHVFSPIPVIGCILQSQLENESPFHFRGLLLYKLLSCMWSMEKKKTLLDI